MNEQSKHADTVSYRVWGQPLKKHEYQGQSYDYILAKGTRESEMRVAHNV